MSKVTTSNWEAWVDTMPGDKPTLHVSADADTHSIDLAVLEKREPQGTNPEILLLDLKTFTGTKPESNPQQIHYKEELKNAEQYEQIDVYFSGELIKRIEEIKVVH